jgi:hypothetical protein
LDYFHSKPNPRSSYDTPGNPTKYSLKDITENYKALKQKMNGNICKKRYKRYKKSTSKHCRSRIELSGLNNLSNPVWDMLTFRMMG